MSDDTGEEVTAEDVAAAREEVVETLARCAEACGAKRSYGRLFGVLYLAAEPMSLDALVEKSGYAKSTVSTAMQTLEHLHLVRRRTVSGEGKRAFFEAEAEFWHVFQRFLDQRIRSEMASMSRSLAAASMVLEAADDERASQELERVQSLERTCDRAGTVVDAFATHSLDRLVAAVDELDGDAS